MEAVSQMVVLEIQQQQEGNIELISFKTDVSILKVHCLGSC
jgi:hypothetical protein